MSGGRNTSQDPDYEGLPGHEKKFHKTHFGGLLDKTTHPKDDPNWEYLGGGRWRRKNDSRPKTSGKQGSSS